MSTAPSVSIYAHQARQMIRTLPRLLEKVLETEARAVVLVDQEVLAAVDKGLWTYTPLGFLPHGSEAMGHPEHQPIWLTSKLENPNNADVLVLYDYAPEGLSEFARGFARVLDLFAYVEPDSAARLQARVPDYHVLAANITVWRDDGAWNKDEDLLQSL